MIVIGNIERIIPLEVMGQLQPPEVDAVLENIAAGARDKWISLAREDKSHFRFEYIDGIKEVQLSPGMATIALTGEVPHLLENGSGVTDMRDFLLGPNVPTVARGKRGKHAAKKGGYYRFIPMRHMTPGTAAEPRGQTFGQEMGKAYAGKLGEVAAKKLGKTVYGAVSQFTGPAGAANAATRTNPYGGKTQWGAKLPAGVGGVGLLKSHHKTDIYAGMYRMEKTYKAKTQASFVTFRTISTNVTEGWMRGAIRARHYAQKVGNYVDKIAAGAFEAYLKGRAS